MATSDLETRLEIVSRSAYEAKPVVNREERRLYLKALHKCGIFNNLSTRAGRSSRRTAHLQVSLRQIVNPIGFFFDIAGAALNGLSVDLLIMDENQHPLVVIEHHGSGHFGDDPRHHDAIAARDLIKEEVLRSAGIALIVSRSVTGSIEAALDEAISPFVRSA